MSGADPESFVRGASQNLDFCFALDIIFSKERESATPFHYRFTGGSMMVPSYIVICHGVGGPDQLPPLDPRMHRYTSTHSTLQHIKV